MAKDEMKEQFSFEKIGVLEGHGGAVTSLVCGVDENNSPLLISGSRDKRIRSRRRKTNRNKKIYSWSTT